MPRFITVLLTALALSGCMVGPDYRRPAADVPQTWRLEEKETQNVANTAWWRQLNDQVLNDLIATALKENKNLLIAAARIEQYAAQYGVSRADLYPQISASVQLGQQMSSKVSGSNAVPPGYHTVSGGQQAVLNASWELDIWGRIRRGTEAARAELLASEEGRRGVILSLVSSVATSYVNLRDLDRQLEIATQTAASRKKTLELFRIRLEGGVITEMELNQAQSEYEQALATTPQLQQAIARQENALSILLGRNPGNIPRGKGINDLKLPIIPAGLPSELLERRPDIRQAELNLIATNAQIGVAKAAYFPAISLTSFLGFASSDLSDLFTGPARVWKYSAPITAPIFTAGKIASSVKVAEAMQQQSLLQYQQAIQTAFREVEDALSDQNRTREQLAAQSRQVEALRQYATLARLRYDEGYSSYIEVLDAERTLFNVELGYTQTQGVLLQAIISLYKSAGGGWVTEAETLADHPGSSAADTPRPCVDEFERFCKDVKPGLGQMILCLDQHRAELSPVCREKVAVALDKLDKAKQDCAADIATYCDGVKPGDGRLLGCLKKEVSRLTPVCRNHLQHYTAAPVTGR